MESRKWGKCKFFNGLPISRMVQPELQMPNVWDIQWQAKRDENVKQVKNLSLKTDSLYVKLVAC